MSREPLSPEARAFIADHVHSVRHLELLLLLRERRDDRWTPQAVATALRASPTWAEHQLEAMRVTGLVTADRATYRYAPAPAEEAALAELDAAYRRRKPTVVQAVLTSMGSDVQALSDAFRMRRPEDG